MIVDIGLDKMFLDRAPEKNSNKQDDMIKTRDFDGVRKPYDSSHGHEETTDKRHDDGPGHHDTSTDTGLQLTDRTVIHVNLLILLSICKFSINS